MGKTSLKDNNKLSKYELMILWISAVLTITFVSTCSPLYPFNPWDDANCFFTIGRGMVKGRILYKDLFDHKGPLLYFVYALTALISGRSFIGAWIAECIMAGVFAVYSWKTVKLFVSTSKNSVLLIPVFIAVVYTSKMFNFGGNAEELCFPLITIALYKGLKAVVKGDGLPKKADALICGILAGTICRILCRLLPFHYCYGNKAQGLLKALVTYLEIYHRTHNHYHTGTLIFYFH